MAGSSKIYNDESDLATLPMDRGAGIPYMQDLGKGVFDSSEALERYVKKCRMIGLYIPSLVKREDGLNICEKMQSVYNVGAREMVVPAGTDRITGIWGDVKINKLRINGDCTCVDNSAFYESGLKELHITHLLKNVGISAFESSEIMGKLKAYRIRCIETYGFASVKGLTEVEIGGELRFIGLGGFKCSGLELLKGRSMNNGGQSRIMEGAFSHCYKLKRVGIETEISNLGSIAFMEDRSLTEVIMPNVNIVSNYTWLGCTGLEVLRLDNCKRAGYHITECCYGLREVSMPNAIGLSKDTFSKYCHIDKLVCNSSNKQNEKDILAYGNIEEIVYR